MSKLQIFTDNYLSADSSIAISASSAAAGFPVANIQNFNRRAKVWRSTGCTSEWIKVDMGISSIPKAFALIGPRNSVLKLTSSATITLQMNSTDSWGSPSYSQVITWDEQALLLVNTAGLGSGNRWMRILIADALNPLGYIEAGIAFLGDLWTPTRAAAQFPLKGKREDRSVITTSEGGQTFSDPREKSARRPVEIFGLTIAEKEDLEDIWETNGKSVPFFISLDPNADVGSVANRHLFFVKFVDEPDFTLISPGVWTVTLDLREEV